jgi:hypothetical protein
MSEPVVKWVVVVQLFFLVVGVIFFAIQKGSLWSISYLVGGLLVFFNFLVLARITPRLVLSRDVKSSIVSLLFSFYSRLLFTGIVLLVCIVFLKFPVCPLIVGLSTIVLGIILWIIRYIVTNNHKEAFNHVSSSSSRIAS